MTAQNIMTSSHLGAGPRRRVRSEKHVEPRVLQTRPQTRKRSSDEWPATQVLAEALAAVVLFLAMLFVLLSPE